VGKSNNISLRATYLLSNICVALAGGTMRVLVVQADESARASQSDLLSAQDSYEQARTQIQISVLGYLRVTGTLRVDPESGTLGRVMDRAELQANNSFQVR